MRPTLADGDSVSVREAVALGRVVVATSVGTRPPEARLVPPADAEALAQGLLEAAQAKPALRLAADADAEPATDSVQRLLALYGWAPPPEEPAAARPKPSRAQQPVQVEAPACAASAAS